jgi:hypothetical protein
VNSLLRWPSRQSRSLSGRALHRRIRHSAPPDCTAFRNRVPRRATPVCCEMSFDSENSVNALVRKHKNFLVRGNRRAPCADSGWMHPAPMRNTKYSSRRVRRRVQATIAGAIGVTHLTRA